MSENGEIYTAGKNFTLPPALTAWTNSTSASCPNHLCPSQSIRPTNSLLNSFKCFHLFKCQLPSTVSKYAPLYVHLSLLCTLKDKFLKHSHLSFNNIIKDFEQSYYILKVCSIKLLNQCPGALYTNDPPSPYLQGM